MLRHDVVTVILPPSQHAGNELWELQSRSRSRAVARGPSKPNPLAGRTTYVVTLVRVFAKSLFVRKHTGLEASRARRTGRDSGSQPACADSHFSGTVFESLHVQVALYPHEKSRAEHEQLQRRDDGRSCEIWFGQGVAEGGPPSSDPFLAQTSAGSPTVATDDRQGKPLTLNPCLCRHVERCR